MCILTFRIAAEVATKNVGCTEVSDLTKCRRRKFLLIREKNLTKRSGCCSFGQRVALFSLKEAKCCVQCTIGAKNIEQTDWSLFQIGLFSPSCGSPSNFFVNYPEDGGRIFIRNVSKNLPVNTASNPGRLIINSAVKVSKHVTLVCWQQVPLATGTVRLGRCRWRLAQ
jgi:hypothetical protein